MEILYQHSKHRVENLKKMFKNFNWENRDEMYNYITNTYSIDFPVCYFKLLKFEEDLQYSIENKKQINYEIDTVYGKIKLNP